MYKKNGQVIFSASDLVHFMECEHLSILDRWSLDEPLERVKDSAEAELVQTRGFEHEHDYLRKAQGLAASYIDIKTVGESQDAQVEATIAAMRKGVDLIFQAAFDSPIVAYSIIFSSEASACSNSTIILPSDITRIRSLNPRISGSSEEIIKIAIPASVSRRIN